MRASSPVSRWYLTAVACLARRGKRVASYISIDNAQKHARMLGKVDTSRGGVKRRTSRTYWTCGD